MRTICLKHMKARSGNFLKINKVLKINGTLLDKNQLKNHLQKIASSHNLTNQSQKETLKATVYHYQVTNVFLRIN